MFSIHSQKFIIKQKWNDGNENILEESYLSDDIEEEKEWKPTNYKKTNQQCDEKNIFWNESVYVAF